jgi:hypothetical protein
VIVFKTMDWQMWIVFADFQFRDWIGLKFYKNFKKIKNFHKISKFQKKFEKFQFSFIKFQNLKFFEKF